MELQLLSSWSSDAHLQLRRGLDVLHEVRQLVVLVRVWDGEERGDGAHGGPLQLVLLLVFLLHAVRLHLGHGMGDGGVSVDSLPRLRCHN